MYKNFKVSEQEKKQIIEMHGKYSYRKPLNEFFDLDEQVTSFINPPAKKTQTGMDRFNTPPRLPNNRVSNPATVKGDLPYVFTQYKWLKGWYKNGPVSTEFYFNNNSAQPCSTPNCLCWTIRPSLDSIDTNLVQNQGWWTVKNNKFYFQEVSTSKI